MKLNPDGKTVAAVDCLVPASVRSSEEARERMITKNYLQGSMNLD